MCCASSIFWSRKRSTRLSSHAARIASRSAVLSGARISTPPISAPSPAANGLTVMLIALTPCQSSAGSAAVRPSRRPRCGLLRMTLFLNSITNLRHPEEARSAVSKDAWLLMRPLLRITSVAARRRECLAGFQLADRLVDQPFRGSLMAAENVAGELRVVERRPQRTLGAVDLGIAPLGNRPRRKGQERDGKDGCGQLHPSGKHRAFLR